MVEPPYLYGLLPGDREDTAAFWCFREGTEKPYLLVFVEKGRVVSSLSWVNYPGGLSRHDKAHLPLSDFRYVDNPEESGPKGVATRYSPLRSEYDGVVTLFYREGNRWLYRIQE